MMLRSRRVRLFFEQARLGRNRQFANRDDVGEGRDAQRPEKLLSQGPAATRATVSRALARSRIARTEVKVLDRAAQVPMARPGPVKVLHLVDLEILVGDEQGDGAAQGHSPPDAGQDLHVIGFDLLPPATAVATLATDDFGIDGLDMQVDSRREAVHQASKARPV